MNMFVFSYSEINERTVWNGRFSKAWCSYTSIDWKCSSECMNLTGIPRSTSNTTAQSDGLLQKACSANKTQWFDRICRRKLRRSVFMQWNHHKIFEKCYESVVKVHENLHFKDRDIYDSSFYSDLKILLVGIHACMSTESLYNCFN